MGELGELIKTPGGLFGSMGTAVVVMAYILRKFWLSDKVQAANAGGNVDAYERLMSMLDRAEKRANEADLRAQERIALAEKRADDAFKERNEAVHEIGALREQVKQLTAVVQRLELEISGYKQQLRGSFQP